MKIHSWNDRQNPQHHKNRNLDHRFSLFFCGNHFQRFTFFLLFVAFCPALLRANPTLPHLFSDHMVLQSGAPIHIWGDAEPGEEIAVDLAGHRAQTIADQNGRWKVELPAMDAGGPFTMTVQGRATIVLRDVMIGEVWVASGQSNMTFALSGVTDAKEEIANANFPQIRFFTVPERVAMNPESDTLDAKWELCTPDTAKDFSAVAYFFARKLQQSLRVPVGIIHSSWPGTAGEEWTDPESLRDSPELRPIVEKWEKSSEEVKSFAERGADFHLEYDDFELLPAENNSVSPKVFSNFDSGESTTSMGGSWTYSWKDAPGTEFELVAPGRGDTGYAAMVKGKLESASSARLEADFGPSADPVDMSAWSGIRFWVRGEGSFQFQMLQPTITDWDNYAAPVVKATPEWKEVTIWFRDLRQAGWGVVNPLTMNSLTGFELVNLSSAGDAPRPPSGLYNGMITPLEDYGIRGVIWYQGESNTWHAYQYRTLLPALIKGWRKIWHEGDFPFLIVQLPNLGTSPELGDSIWAQLREAQLLTAETVPNTGLAVTIDLGDPKNLHPPNKAPVGERLALWALVTTYGEKIEYSGPLYHSMDVEGNHIRIHFTYTGTGLEAKGGGALKGFSIAGADRKFHWADAEISGDTVVVSSADVANPVAVRYAWANSPECNLYNKEGLPASPFKTDDWPGASYNKR
jgi:sialate O-acetylesterase